MSIAIRVSSKLERKPKKDHEPTSSSSGLQTVSSGSLVFSIVLGTCFGGGCNSPKKGRTFMKKVRDQKNREKGWD